jgi:hypothetical protein
MVTTEPVDSAIAFRLHARDAHLVTSSAAQGPIPVQVTLDGEAPGPSRGVYIIADANGLLDVGCVSQ